MKFYILCHAYSINEISRYRDNDCFISRSFTLNTEEIISLI